MGLMLNMSQVWFNKKIIEVLSKICWSLISGLARVPSQTHLLLFFQPLQSCQFCHSLRFPFPFWIISNYPCPTGSSVLIVISNLCWYQMVWGVGSFWRIRVPLEWVWNTGDLGLARQWSFHPGEFWASFVTDLGLLSVFPGNKNYRTWNCTPGFLGGLNCRSFWWICCA